MRKGVLETVQKSHVVRTSRPQGPNSSSSSAGGTPAPPCSASFFLSFWTSGPLWLFLILISIPLSAATPGNLEKLDTEQIRRLPSEGESVVINFWATWCVPCVEEIPIFTKIQKQFKDIVVIGISTDDPDREDLVRKFVQDHPMDYRVAFWTGNNFEAMVNSIDPHWNGPIPATFVFKKGKLAHSKIGQVTEAELLKLLQ